MKIKSSYKPVVLGLIYIFVTAFQSATSLKGTWEFVGGIYNGKKEGAPDGYSLQRKYSKVSYDAFVIEKGNKAEKFEAGTYSLKADTCTDTETYCNQPSKITNIPIHYLYLLKNDTLTLKGALPGGMVVEEYWKKIK